MSLVLALGCSAGSGGDEVETDAPVVAESTGGLGETGKTGETGSDPSQTGPDSTSDATDAMSGSETSAGAGESGDTRTRAPPARPAHTYTRRRGRCQVRAEACRLAGSRPEPTAALPPTGAANAKRTKCGPRYTVVANRVMQVHLRKRLRAVLVALLRVRFHHIYAI